jgi:hypothetical protein
VVSKCVLERWNGADRPAEGIKEDEDGKNSCWSCEHRAIQVGRSNACA